SSLRGGWRFTWLRIPRYRLRTASNSETRNPGRRQKYTGRQRSHGSDGRDDLARVQLFHFLSNVALIRIVGIAVGQWVDVGLGGRAPAAPRALHSRYREKVPRLGIDCFRQHAGLGHVLPVHRLAILRMAGVARDGALQ